MRFIVVLVLFSIVAYASCSEDAEQDALDIDSTELFEDEPEEITYAEDKSKKKCDAGKCSRKCKKSTKPVYEGFCRKNKCVCRKIKL